MTFIRAVFLICNGAPPGEPDCEAAYESDPVPQSRTVAEARAEARRWGWTRTRDGRDLCPVHNGSQKEP